MLSGIFHTGSGVGNQLHRYVATRVFALDKGFEWGMACPENCKATFMNLDMGKPVPFPTRLEMPAGKVVVETDWPLFEEDTRDYDWRVKDVQDNTIIDGEFQGEEYFMHRLDEIREWLKVEPLEMPDDLCVINFRGGEYVGLSYLFLPLSYWSLGIAEMKKINPQMRFEVHTDDPDTARRFFPEYTVIHDVALNWRSIRYAKYLLLSNSSFAILPALLGDAKKIIAPKGWLRRNTGEQFMKYNVYKRFTHI